MGVNEGGMGREEVEKVRFVDCIWSRDVLSTSVTLEVSVVRALKRWPDLMWT